MKITRFVSWFGANAAHADKPAQILSECDWVFIPFAGSMCEIPHFKPRVQIMASDTHRELIILADAIKEPHTKMLLGERLSRKLFHPESLEKAQAVLREARAAETGDGQGLFANTTQRTYAAIEVAEAFFVIAWMGRSAVVGTNGDENVGLALRYDGGGGDPVKRYHAAVESLDAWHEQMRRCSFSTDDVFDVIARVRTKVSSASFNPRKHGNVIGFYCDPPWIDQGDGYLKKFSIADQERLARELGAMPHVHVCMRFGDHPKIRELYPDSTWQWEHVAGRDQHREKVREVFLTKRHHAV